MLFGDRFTLATFDLLQQSAVHEAAGSFLVAPEDRLSRVAAGCVAHSTSGVRHADGELAHRGAWVLREPRFGQHCDRLRFDPAQIDLPGLRFRGRRHFARQVMTFGEAVLQHALHLDNQCMSDVLEPAIRGLLNLVQAQVDTVLPQLLLEDDRQLPRRGLVVAELPGPRQTDQARSRLERTLLSVLCDFRLTPLPVNEIGRAHV